MRLLLITTALAGFCQCRNKQQSLNLAPQGIGQPLIGFGTWNLKESPENTTSAVAIAIEAGYRQIDCAAAYGNEKEVGKGIAKGLEKAGLKREEIWITSKLWNDHHDPDRVEAGLNQTLSDLGLDYLDLYLMHWPVGKGPTDESYRFDYYTTWQAMIKLLDTGRVRHIGVCNFAPMELLDLIRNTAVKPAVHQMELHPYLPQTKWIRMHQEHGISITAYSPLGNMNPTYGDRSRRPLTTQNKAPLLLKNKVVVEIAEKRECTPAQVVLAWGISRGTSVIPKSKHEEYIKENLEAQKCMLEERDLDALGELGEEPVRFNNPSKGWNVELFQGLQDS
ncbi:Aldo/keto reductase [Byssothecium circinans]|uniref:Aldo/keto reductase n=1 Tax=Byssothecium circinans TaxID=147558 RepID=A0A6A5TPB9_9PLEO|nr:Aldo/keto reductase [Byssothecium circinans]